MSKTLEQIADMLDKFQPDQTGLGFDMGEQLPSEGFFDEDGCGTACCIGGWVQFFNPETRRLDLTSAVVAVSPLTEWAARQLCWGELSPEITPKQGAQAIRNALKFQDPKWEEILDD
jgi:hypothetical protein